MSSARSGRARPTGVRRPKPAHAASSSHSSYSLLSFQAESMPTARMRLRRHACHLGAHGARRAQRVRPGGAAGERTRARAPAATPADAVQAQPGRGAVQAARSRVRSGRSHCCGQGTATEWCHGRVSGSARVGSVPGPVCCSARSRIGSCPSPTEGPPPHHLMAAGLVKSRWAPSPSQNWPMLGCPSAPAMNAPRAATSGGAGQRLAPETAPLVLRVTRMGLAGQGRSWCMCCTHRCVHRAFVQASVTQPRAL